MGIILSIIDWAINIVINIVLLVVELVLLPFRLIIWVFMSLCNTVPSTGYWSRPWGWRWNRRQYL